MAFIKLSNKKYLCQTNGDRDVTWDTGALVGVLHVTDKVKWYRLEADDSWTFLYNQDDAPNNELPSQTGNNGKFLKTNGTDLSWGSAGGGAFSGTMDDIDDGALYVKTENNFTDAQVTKLAGIASGATSNSSDATLLNRANHTGTQSADSITDGTTNKAYTASEKTKLAGIATGATANDTDANLKNTDNHTNGTTNKVFTATEKTKLAGIATGATANDTDANLKNTDNHTDGTTNKVYSATDKTKLAGIATGATANATNAQLRDRSTHTGTQDADSITDGTTNKAYTAVEKTKLAGIATSATANDTDANLKARGNHTGTQLAATISDFNAAALSAAPAETANTVGSLLNGSAAATPNDTDIVATSESSVLKKITWTNIKAFLKTYFDTLYATIANLNLKAPLASPTFTGTVTLPAGQVVNGVTLNSTGSASQYLNAVGNYVTVSAGDIVYAPTPADVAINNVADVTIVTRNITGFAAGDQAIMEGEFIILNNSGATRVYVITLDFDGAFDIEITTPALAASATLMHPFSYRAVCNIRSTSLAYCVVSIDMQVAAGIASGGDTTMAATPLSGFGWGSSASDLSGTLTCSLAIRSANATATQTCRVVSHTVRKVSPVG